MIILALFVGALALLFLGFEMLLVLGLPGIATKVLFFGNLPDILYGQKIGGGINHTTLMAIPFFVLAAELMARGNIARQLTELVKSMIGHRRVAGRHTHRLRRRHRRHHHLVVRDLHAVRRGIVPVGGSLRHVASALA